MRWVWIIIIGMALLVLEVGLMSSLAGIDLRLLTLRVFDARPDLMLLFVIFLALYGPREDAAISGWMLGIAKDALSTDTFGLYAVLYMCVAFLLSRVRGEIFLEFNKAHMVNAGLATFVVYLAAILWHWSGGAAPLGKAPVVMGVALWNAALAPAAFHVFFAFGRRLDSPRRLA